MEQVEVIEFYGWWQMSVCLFAFVALMGIWYHIGRKQNDFGQVYLALSVLCWSFSGLVSILYADSLLSNSSTSYDGLTSILSLFNSLFILLALPWFRYIPDIIRPLVKSNYWLLIVGLPFVFSLLPTLSKIYTQNEHAIIAELDVYYSIFTLIFLGIIMWQSFAQRRLKFLAYLSVFCILLTFAAQVFKLAGFSFNLLLYSAIFKTCLIMIFFALALSWVKELAENVIPFSAQMKLKFFRTKNEKGRYAHKVSIEGFPGNHPRLIELSATHFDLLHLFAARRKTKEQEWLEIKPKNGIVNKVYDINDHNQVKRILHSILDSIFGKNNWTKELHELPLRSSLFEVSANRERKIRLLVPDQNITLLVEK